MIFARKWPIFLRNICQKIPQFFTTFARIIFSRNLEAPVPTASPVSYAHEAAYRIADDVAHLARPVRQVSEQDGRQLTDPDGQQAGVEDQRVGDGHDHQEEVG